MAASKPQPSELPTLPFVTQRAFAAWLTKHHASPDGLWIKMARAKSGIESISYQEALEVALCWGWIDGQSRRIDETWFVQKFTPRRARSMWSKINRERVTQLIAAGKMKPAGLAEIERAKQDGRWERAYDSPSRATPPEDLLAALAKNRKAAAFFAKLNSINRYAILHRVQTAKKPETRARRIAQFVAMLARHEKLHE
ncbi:MAG TPA: YdeI/OmpD-associated family protein [Polyangiales bacterium]|nr:YdeI/OmpD-associated family protein [Polyangiales bacterium]